MGESDDDFPWGLRFQSPEVEERWFVSYPLVGFFFLLVFCNHQFLVSRYKRLHAARAMEKTKSINPNQ